MTERNIGITITPAREREIESIFRECEGNAKAKNIMLDDLFRKVKQGEI